MDSTRSSERRERRDLTPAHCPRCEGTTTHAGDVCVGCLTRAENRRHGWLWLALGAPLLLLGGMAIRTIPSFWPVPYAHRSSLAVALLLLVAGATLAGRGLRAIVRGRSPD